MAAKIGAIGVDEGTDTGGSVGGDDGGGPKNIGDKVPPIITPDSFPNPITDEAYTFTGTATDKSGIASLKWKIDNGQLFDLIMENATQWKLPLNPIPLGDHTVTIQAIDNSRDG